MNKRPHNEGGDLVAFIIILMISDNVPHPRCARFTRRWRGCMVLRFYNYDNT